MIDNLENTIAAISTPPGRGGIAIIRLSGKQSIEIANKIFRGQCDLLRLEPWKATLGKIIDNGIEVDEVLVIVFKSPNSYTREDMVEISCHGGIYVSQRVLQLAIQHGARLTQPGEFTLRAFLNGRIDLSQAEAVADLIQAQTEASLRVSFSQLEGRLSAKVTDMSNRLIDFASLLELELDFSEEDVEFVDRSDFINQLKNAQKELEKIIATYQIGKMAREGVKLVIVGKPNVGKSSLLNALVKEERAIVTDVPGTTRDPLEVQLDIKGVWFRIFDTAGIKESDDRIEQEGIKRARRHLESADIIVHVFDGTLALEKEDHDIIDAIHRLDRSRVVRVINKSDLSQNIERENLHEESVALLSLSAVTGEGIESLEDEIYRGVLNDDSKSFSDEIMVTNVRHWEALKNGVESLSKAIEQAEQGMSSEFISLYLRDALNYLGQITGKVTSEDILNNIFSRFCIGK